MSSNLTRGGIAGVVAAALLVLSAILNQLSPVQATYDSAADYLYLAVVLAAYIAVPVAVLGIHACTTESLDTGSWALSER